MATWWEKAAAPRAPDEPLHAELEVPEAPGVARRAVVEEVRTGAAPGGRARGRWRASARRRARPRCAPRAGRFSSTPGVPTRTWPSRVSRSSRRRPRKGFSSPMTVSVGLPQPQTAHASAAPGRARRASREARDAGRCGAPHERIVARAGFSSTWSSPGKPPMSTRSAFERESPRAAATRARALGEGRDPHEPPPRRQHARRVLDEAVQHRPERRAALHPAAERWVGHDQRGRRARRPDADGVALDQRHVVRAHGLEVGARRRERGLVQVRPREAGVGAGEGALAELEPGAHEGIPDHVVRRAMPAARTSAAAMVGCEAAGTSARR